MDQVAPPSGTTERVTPLVPAPTDPYKSARRLATIVAASLTIHIVFDIAAAAVDVQMLGLLDRAREGAVVTFEEAQAHDDRMFWAGVLQGIAALAVMIPFIVWLRRVYRNLGPLGTRRLRYKPGWAVGGWFVPFLNLARPKAIVNDVWRASDPELPPEIEGPPGGARVPGVVNWWWAAFIAGWIVYPSPSLQDRPSLDELTTDVQRILAGDLLEVVAGILAIVMVLKLTQRQEQRHAVLAQQTGSPLL